MQANQRDAAHLWDMREAARDCIDFVANATYDRYGDVNLHQLWQSLQRDVPELLPKLNGLIPPAEGS